MRTLANILTLVIILVIYFSLAWFFTDVLRFEWFGYILAGIVTFAILTPDNPQRMRR